MSTQPGICPKHNTPLVLVEKLGSYHCKECLYSSFLTQTAQDAAIKRYNQTPKHKESAKRYEQGTGKEAREKYLKSDKYKQRRREYNQRLAESLRIARSAKLDRATSEKVIEKRGKSEFVELIEDIREYLDNQNRQPSALNVVRWAKENYGRDITEQQAQNLIKKALNRS